jgi:hypothetical protein
VILDNVLSFDYKFSLCLFNNFNAKECQTIARAAKNPEEKHEIKFGLASRHPVGEIWASTNFTEEFIDKWDFIIPDLSKYCFIIK